MVSGKIAGGSTYFGFYCIFINKFFKNLPGEGGGGAVSYPLYPLCASMIHSVHKVSYLLSDFFKSNNRQNSPFQS